MPSILGKRKSRPSEEESAAARAKAQAVFRQHFEARFKPLPDALVAPVMSAAASLSGDEEDDDDETESDVAESEWGGISDDQDQEAEVVEVVHHTSTDTTGASGSSMTKRDLKIYMSSRPPVSILGSSAPQDGRKRPGAARGRADDEGGNEDSATLLANDLALQRLIAESHILSAAGANPAHYLSSSNAAAASSDKELFAAGRTRRLTTELRLRQALAGSGAGAASAPASQAKMPMAMRKGIAAAAAAREERRRREAREAGVVLERAVGGKKRNGKDGGKKKKRRPGGERPVDMPGVGRMRGAELRISARHVRAIEGPSGGGAGGLKGGRPSKRRR